MSLKRIAPLRHLIKCLEQYIEDEEASDPQQPPTVIKRGQAVHDAVMLVEASYPGKKLPGPARIAWMDLLQVSRGKRTTDRPNQEAKLGLG